MERNKEMTCFQSSRTSANHWGRKEKKKKKRKGKASGEESWRRGREEIVETRVFQGVQG